MARRRRPAPLSAHFQLEEFACHDGTPAPARSIPALRGLCREFLEPLRLQFGPVTIVSGYRTAPYNAAVGGAPDSRHVYDNRPAEPAADVSCERGDPIGWARALNELGAGGLGLYRRHAHIDLRPGHVRWTSTEP